MACCASSWVFPQTAEARRTSGRGRGRCPRRPGCPACCSAGSRGSSSQRSLSGRSAPAARRPSRAVSGGEPAVGPEQHAVVEVVQQHRGRVGGERGHRHFGAQERRVVAGRGPPGPAPWGFGEVGHGGTLGPSAPGAQGSCARPRAPRRDDGARVRCRGPRRVRRRRRAPRALLRCWTDVSNAGGAVGFVPPVTRRRRARARPPLDGVHSGRDVLPVLTVDGEPAGFATLVSSRPLRGTGPRCCGCRCTRRARGRARPGADGGRARLARGTGREFLHLTVRGGTGVEASTAAWATRSAAARRIRVAPGDDRDEFPLVRPL